MKFISMKKMMCLCLLLAGVCTAFTSCGSDKDEPQMPVGSRITAGPLELITFQSDVFFAITTAEQIESARAKMSPEDVEKAEVTDWTDNRYILGNVFKHYLNPDFRSDLYETTDGFKTIIRPALIVNTKSESVINSILAKYKGVLTLTNKNLHYGYTLECNLRTDLEVIRLADKIHKMDGVDYCEPSIYSEIRFF